MTVVSCFVRYYEMIVDPNDSTKKIRSGNILIEQNMTGKKEVVRAGLLALSKQSDLSGHEAEYSFTATTNNLPVPIEQWWT